MSIDTRTALAKLLGQFWSHTRTRVYVPPGFLKPLRQPAAHFREPWNTPMIIITPKANSYYGNICISLCHG